MHSALGVSLFLIGCKFKENLSRYTFIIIIIGDNKFLRYVDPVMNNEV